MVPFDPEQKDSEDRREVKAPIEVDSLWPGEDHWP
jgi:hypothetical protein